MSGCLLPGFDLRDLEGEIGRDEAPALTGAEMIERTRPHDRQVMAEVVLQRQHILRHFADAVGIGGAQRRIFGGGLIDQLIAVDVAGTDDQQSRLEAAFQAGERQIQLCVDVIFERAPGRGIGLPTLAIPAR